MAGKTSLPVRNQRKVVAWGGRIAEKAMSGESNFQSLQIIPCLAEEIEPKRVLASVCSDALSVRSRDKDFPLAGWTVDVPA